MSVQYRGDRCAEVAEAPAAVGWVQVQPLGAHPLLPEEPTHLCRLCWARTSAGEPVRVGSGGAEVPQVSEHSQNRDLGQ
ncbi:hypothetical protein [Modestobacter marinus]|uniref:hypothetical protein n=1 Tax=Modestobacter marinus TaxID=477641 RepID=UPI00201A242E|nr:hypothetical protein [Modestobacter marinus]